VEKNECVNFEREHHLKVG